MATTSAGAAAVPDPERNVVDYVSDAEPSPFLRCTMSRRISPALVVRERLEPFLRALLQRTGDDDSATTTDTNAMTELRGITYGQSARRVILLELATAAAAERLRAELHERPCALLHGRPMYVEFALHRRDKEARDALARVPSISRIRALEDPSARVPGLVLLPEFVSPEVETRLLDEFDADDGRHWCRTVRARQVQHYGYAFDYETRRCDVRRPLPEPMPPSLVRLIDQIPTSIMTTPDQITVNEYLPGQGIAAHIDTHGAFAEAIASLSLGHEIVMEFRHAASGRCESVLLQPRTLLIMTGAARYEWTHAIPPRPFDVIDGVRVDRQRRVSVTFRKVQTTPCTCDFPVQCEAQATEQRRLAARHGDPETKTTTGGDSRAPTPVEEQYVHQFYETVARHFSSTRYNPWPRVAAFVRELPEGSWIADIGCGNGKYMKCVDAHASFVVGGDRSPSLARICREDPRSRNVLVADALAVPIRSGSCDAALSIAVLHHLSTPHHRLAAVEELIRVLRIGGRGIIYAWAHEQMANSKRRFDESTQEFMVPWNLDKRFVNVVGNDATDGTPAITGAADGGPMVVQRYCHMFKQGELEELVVAAGGADIEESYYDESNWAVILRRAA